VKTPKFATEAELCAAFIAWIKHERPDMGCFAEWAGWDILLAYPDGWQIGIQAKLRLNAEVMLQAVPDRWSDGFAGPDYRAILVPATNGWSALAQRLGLIVFAPDRDQYESRGIEFHPALCRKWSRGSQMPGSDWQDWNPAKRLKLPPCETDAIAGSPCPVSLTPWKLGALDVLAELNTRGSITTKRIREIGIDPNRWTQARWIEPTETRGTWTLGERCPRFDQQHPTAFAAALEKARP
jgi:hypothetical protein